MGKLRLGINNIDVKYTVSWEYGILNKLSQETIGAWSKQKREAFWLEINTLNIFFAESKLPACYTAFVK